MPIKIPQELLLKTIFVQAPIGIAISHNINGDEGNDCLFTYINPKYEEITGRSRRELIKLGWAKITHPDDLEGNIKKFKRIQSGEIDSYSMEKRFIHPDGRIVWVHMVVSKLDPIKGHQYNHICLIQDITEYKEAELALLESERSKSVYLSHFPGMAYRCKYDKDWTIQYVSQGCVDLTGYPVEALLYNKDLAFIDLIPVKFREPMFIKWKEAVKNRKAFRQEYQIITASGERKWVIEMGQGIYNSRGEVEFLEGIILDISDRKKIEDDLRYHNEHDSWTGLYNLKYLTRLLEIDTMDKGIEKQGLISINLSALQPLVMTHGFSYVQDLIKKTSEALELFVTDKSLVFRTYENRFVFYLKDYLNRRELVEFCYLIRNILKPILSIEGIGCGLGIIEINKDETVDINEVFKKLLISSEKALSNNEGDFAICFYDTDMESEIIREEEVKQELYKIAMGKNDENLFLHYQPIIDLKSNKVSGFEALARIKSDNLGLISPMEFIPIAEKTKLIIPIGQRVIHKAFEFLKKLKDMGHTSVNLSINASLIEVLGNDFINNLLNIIYKMEINPNDICIEITESVLISNYGEINNVIAKLQDLGFNIAIDDFGTGYSSLARGEELRVNTIKIDKSFVDKLLVVKPEKSIVSDIISMIHKLGYIVVAEGVEDIRQWKYLQTAGCDKVQGYLISKPLIEEKAIEFLEKFIGINDVKN